MAPSTESKRKRGLSGVVGTVDGDLVQGKPSKRRKSVKDGILVLEKQKQKEPNNLEDLGSDSPVLKSSDAGLASAVRRMHDENIRVNGTKGGTPEVRETRANVEDAEAEVERKRQRKENKKERKARARETNALSELWKISAPIGGRMVNADPVFSADEQFLLLANWMCINVYSTSDSLLIRSIKLRLQLEKEPDARIISYCLSPTQDHMLWVACSNGVIYNIDWTTGEGTDDYWPVSSQGCVYMTVAAMMPAKQAIDVIFTSEPTTDGRWRMTAHHLEPSNRDVETTPKTIFTSEHRIDMIKSVGGGSIVIGIAGKNVLVGWLRKTTSPTVSSLKYEFRIFQSSNHISSMDVRIAQKANHSKSGPDLLDVNLVVGDVMGTIFVHNDLLRILAPDRSRKSVNVPHPRRLHWHRRSVHAVKFSRDGNYIISGGTETVLVLWQIDTGSPQFLPHVAATIQNIVVSPRGSSYGIQLGDNSTMVLSTAELEPTANVAGLQACVIDPEFCPDTQVDRVQGNFYNPPVVQRTPAVINPAAPTILLLGVGQTQTIDPRKPAFVNAPFLQTYDLGSGHNRSRQCLTRSNATNFNMTPAAFPVSEPRVTHLQLSDDGKWLASVDQWTPPAQDFEHLKVPGIDLEIELQRRREVYLKFWQWHETSNRWELVSRIDAPHTVDDELGVAGKVTDLAADPTALRFATIGEDNLVKTWTTRARKRDGIIVRDEHGSALRSWGCQHAIPLCKSEIAEFANRSSADCSTRFHGCLAWSEDSSVLAAAMTSSVSSLYLLDTYTGALAHQIPDLAGPVIRLAFLSQFLIILSASQLRVHDIVTQTLLYGFSLDPSLASLSLLQKTEMFHLAVSPASQSFAIALPSASFSKLKAQSTLLKEASELYVFKTDTQMPLFQRKMSKIVTALIPAQNKEGFLILDAAAQVYTVNKQGKLSVTDTAKSTTALRLEHTTDDAVAGLNEEEEEDDEEILVVEKVDADAEEDTSEDQSKVVTKEELAAVFNIGPSFALPSLTELFYSVVELWDTKTEGEDT